MPSSPEHDHISRMALRIMEEASRSTLFGYTEGQRKLFDFSCELKRDWSKAVVGQTLWKHSGDGIDKDLRTFITEQDVSAAIYIARDESKHRARLTEVTQSYRNGPLRDRLSRLRVFWIPSDFDAKSEEKKRVIHDLLRDAITKDLLLHVTLGGLTSQDVTRFASSRRPGFPIAILSHVRELGYSSHKATAATLGMRIDALKQETERLFILGFLGSDSLQGGIYHLTDSGRSLLDICARLRDYLQGDLGDNNENKDFEHIAKLLGIQYPSIPVTTRLLGKSPEVDIQNPTALLLQHVAQADADGSVSWPEPYFALPSTSDSP
ncbi:hypothetical protein ACFV6E_09825 [Streptomyces sp. NPDC059785]|uniref:hypothetical protein n=1 Tax=Streptomyces sp. NPDC059785 TaxID=3346945 RepID=UPI003647591C